MNIHTMQQSILDSVNAHQDDYTAASDAIWAHPQVNFHEDFAAGQLCGLLEENGFSVEKGLDGMPTAFRAQFGSSKPVIAFWANTTRSAH